MGLATPSPDGKLIAYVTFNAKAAEQPHWTFWGNATVWVVPAAPGGKPRAVTHASPSAINTLRWLNNKEIVFDRSASKQFYDDVRLWKVRID